MRQEAELMLHHFLLIFFFVSPNFALDFLFNSLNATTNLTFIGDARIDSSVIKLTNASSRSSVGWAFYPTPINMTTPTGDTTTISSFSTSFVFSILPETSSTPGSGLGFILSKYKAEPFFPLIAVEFDTGQNQEFNDPDGNHVGVNLNNSKSDETQRAGYFDLTGAFIPVDMRNGQNIRTWIDFYGDRSEIEVTIAPTDVPRPSRPLFTFYGTAIANYISSKMFIGFAARRDTFVEAQRVLAWSFSDNRNARDINTTKLPVFQPEEYSSLSAGGIAGISIVSVVFTFICLYGFYWFWRKRKKAEDTVEEWELEYWPHRFSYKELSAATKGFSNEELLGSGGFGKVYKGTLVNNTEVAVKCVNHDLEQGLREFMAEISSMGRLQHKNLVHMKGWCRKANELMLVYNYMPNGSLNRWIFDKPKQLLGWEGRRRVLLDVAEALNYLHHGWDQMVLHRDIKPSNILLDSELQGRLGDFGLAKLYHHGSGPGTTRLVGTLGYLAPELVNVGATAASDVYSFGVTVLEGACGRKPIELRFGDEPLLVDWVRQLHAEGRLCEAADPRMGGEYSVEDMKTVLMLGLACCHSDPRHRPNMKEVVAMLMGGDASAGLGSLLSETAEGGGGDSGGGGGKSEETSPLFDGRSNHLRFDPERELQHRLDINL